MITEKDYPARQWDVLPAFTGQPLLDPAVLGEMSKHPESKGESSWGTRNILASFVLSMRPKLFLEIGSHIGSGAVVVGSALKANGFGRMVCLEPEDHYFALLNQFVDAAKVREYVEPMKILSTAPDLLAKLGEAPDMIFIDANHSYSHALRDIQISASILAPGGIIFLDDVGDPLSGEICQEGKGGVRKALLDFSGNRDDLSVIFFDAPYWLNRCGFAMMSRKPPKQAAHPSEWISSAPKSA